MGRIGEETDMNRMRSQHSQIVLLRGHDELANVIGHRCLEELLRVSNPDHASVCLIENQCQPTYSIASPSLASLSTMASSVCLFIVNLEGSLRLLPAKAGP